MIEPSTQPTVRPQPQKPPVLFVGAGPGDPELITLRGARALAEADVVVWAGSLVHRSLLGHCRPGADIHDSASMALPDIVATLAEGCRSGKKVVRLHTGDPSLYGAIAEQMVELDALEVPYEVVPGVSSFAASAAALAAELTMPGISQTVILTRRAGRTPVPDGQDLASLASHRATLCIFLSVGQIAEVVADLSRHYPPSTAVAVVANASWPEQRVVRGTLADIAGRVVEASISKTAMILVGDVLAKSGERSKLYDPAFSHGYRAAITDPAGTTDTPAATDPAETAAERRTDGPTGSGTADAAGASTA
jgi:precorrin-4/cobalt-precorrin-4 C11-methyltransferase